MCVCVCVCTASPFSGHCPLPPLFTQQHAHPVAPVCACVFVWEQYRAVLRELLVLVEAPAHPEAGDSEETLARAYEEVSALAAAAAANQASPPVGLSAATAGASGTSGDPLPSRYLILRMPFVVFVFVVGGGLLEAI